MKANEAPKKLYVNFHFIETHPASNQPLVTKQGVNKYDIEYTRTDTFIEKACSWLKENGGSYWMDDYDLPTDDLVNDFRKYMEGE